MPRHVLVPIDGSEQSWAAFRHALETFEGERITVLTVVDPMEAVSGSIEGGYYDSRAHERALDRGEKICEAAIDRADAAGALSSTVLETAVESGRTARTILEYVDEHDVDHVVMGSHGRSGVSRILLGSVSESVIRRAPVPVTVVR